MPGSRRTDAVCLYKRRSCSSAASISPTRPRDHRRERASNPSTSLKHNPRSAYPCLPPSRAEAVMTRVIVIDVTHCPLPPYPTPAQTHPRSTVGRGRTHRTLKSSYFHSSATLVVPSSAGVPDNTTAVLPRPSRCAVPPGYLHHLTSLHCGRRVH